MTPREEKLERQISWMRDQRAHLERVGDLTEIANELIEDELIELRTWSAEERDRSRDFPNDEWPDWERRADERIARFDLDRFRIFLSLLIQS
jgi:hypothetical protein